MDRKSLHRRVWGLSGNAFPRPLTSDERHTLATIVLGRRVKSWSAGSLSDDDLLRLGDAIRHFQTIDASFGSSTPGRLSVSPRHICQLAQFIFVLGEEPSADELTPEMLRQIEGVFDDWALIQQNIGRICG